jgi:exonuclease VII small subunit
MGGNVTDAGNGRPAVRDLSYTDASRELDDIVRFFEQRDVDVDQLVGRLERATAIVDELDRRLRRTRTQVEELVPRLAAVLSADGRPDDEPSGGEPDAAAPDQTAPGASAPVDTAPDDTALDDEEIEVELDEADELVEAIDEVIGDDGDPGPAEPRGLF